MQRDRYDILYRVEKHHRPIRKMDRFRGRVALVTGASAGIGEAIARQLSVDHGMKVVGCARRLSRLQNMEKEFEKYNKEVKTNK